MSLDPNLPMQLQTAARAVQGVLQSIRTAAQSPAVSGVAGWRGPVATRHLMELDRLRTRLDAAIAALGTLEAELQAGAVRAGQAIADEAAAARAAAAAEAAPVYGPPWPGYGGY